MVIGRSVHLLIAAVLVCGLLTLTWISKSVDQSQIARLSVSGVEKIQKLDERIGNRLANEELAKWDKLEQKIFPSDSSKKSVKAAKVVHGVKHAINLATHRSQHKGNIFFSAGSGRHSTDARFRHQSTPAHVQMPHHPSVHVNSVRSMNHHMQQKALQVCFGLHCYHVVRSLCSFYLSVFSRSPLRDRHWAMK
jgi:hypothetical protein